MAGTRRSSRLSGAAEKKLAEDAASPLPTQKSRKRKATSEANGDAAPKTPTKKRRQKEAVPEPTTPSNPVSSAPGLMAESATKKARNRTVARLADPMSTNATLLSPESSRVVGSRDLDSISPSKVSKSAITTENLLERACEHLISVDERIRPLVEKNHCDVFSPEGLAEKVDPFESLASGIISQQVSGAAAKSIKAKFVALFSDADADADADQKRFPHPSEVAPCSIEKLRTAGLSQRKAEYIKGLAEKFTNGDLTAQMLHDAPYDELFEKLIAVRGLGQWSVEMFAFFGLKRMDIFSVGDLGVQRGMAAFVGRDIAKLKSKGGKWKYMSEKEMLEISERFAPYRSLFMWLMWRAEGSFTDVSTMN